MPPNDEYQFPWSGSLDDFVIDTDTGERITEWEANRRAYTQSIADAVQLANQRHDAAVKRQQEIEEHVRRFMKYFGWLIFIPAFIFGWRRESRPGK